MPKCSDCGFLAVRDEYNDAVCEATDFCRDRGRHQSSQGNATRAKAFCYLDEPFISVNFNKENEIADQLKAEHQCTKWMKWRPGKSPKEHEEMHLLQKVEQEHLKYREIEKRERDADRKAELELRAAEKAEDIARLAGWRGEDISSATRRFRFQELRLWIAVGISILALIVSAIVATYNWPK